MEGLGVNLPPGSNTVQGNDDDRFELTIRDANRALAKMRRSVGGCLTARQKRPLLTVNLDEHLRGWYVLGNDGCEKRHISTLGSGDVRPLQLGRIELGKATAHELVNATGVHWRLTFDMSGGAKGAQRPLGRPLDGGVRRHRARVQGRDVLNRACQAETMAGEATTTPVPPTAE